MLVFCYSCVGGFSAFFIAVLIFFPFYITGIFPCTYFRAFFAIGLWVFVRLFLDIVLRFTNPDFGFPSLLCYRGFSR